MTYLVASRELSDAVVIDSAGTSGYHVGELPDKRMRAAALRRGIELTSRSRIVVPKDFSRFDLVVAMDRSNLRELMGLAGGGGSLKVKLLSEYLDDDWPIDVPDPYYGGEEGFEQVLDMLEAACPRILDAVIGHR